MPGLCMCPIRSTHTEAVDLDADGYIDLLTSNDGPRQILLGKGDGGFTARQVRIR